MSAASRGVVGICDANGNGNTAGTDGNGTQRVCPKTLRERRKWIVERKCSFVDYSFVPMPRHSYRDTKWQTKRAVSALFTMHTLS